MQNENTVGREPVQILEIKQPLCGNVYGVAPCTATGSVGEECYNTRATCQDVDNFRFDPEFLLTPDAIKLSGDTITDAEILRGDDLFAAVDLYIPQVPTGTIWHQGDNVVGAYLGFTSGDLVWRTGDASTVGGTTTTTRLTADVSAFYGKEVTILIEYVDATSVNNLWIWDKINRIVTFIGTLAPTTTFANWSGTPNGNVGTVVGDAPNGEDATDFNGFVHELRIYNDLGAPNLTNAFVLPLYFSSGFVADQTVEGADYILPSLVSVSTVPTKINLSGSSPDASGLGNRAVLSAEFQDHPHSDRKTDPYRETRLQDAKSLGSFWSKWMVRNAYRYNMRGQVYEGYLGQSLSDMQRRSYILTGAAGPNETGGVSLQFKDIFASIEERKSQAPQASNGILLEDIDNSQTTFSIFGATISEYPATGTVRIGDELITYSARVENGDNIDFTVTLRGADNSIADEHDADETVQSCLRFTDKPVNEILNTLFVDWADISRENLDINGTFLTETQDSLAAYILSTVISEPTPISLLLSELQEHVGFYLWWHEVESLVKMSAIRGVSVEPPLWTSETNMLAKSFSISDIPRNRISQVWLSHSQVDPTKALDSNSNFLQTKIQADLASEGPSQYGESSIRKIYSRWLKSTSLALSTASKIVARYSKVPRRAKFRVDAKDRAIWVGDTVRISHFLDVDQNGNRNVSNWTIISAESVIPGEVIEMIADDTTLYGKTTTIQANGSPDYQGDGTDPFAGAFIGGNMGLLSDGTACARIT